MRKDKLRVAVVGLGFGAEFVPIYLTHPDVQSVVICDSNPERLGGVGSKFGIEKQFKDVEEVIQSENIDAVHHDFEKIGTPKINFCIVPELS